VTATAIGEIISYPFDRIKVKAISNINPSKSLLFSKETFQICI
jgi:hypothetical protein